MEDQATLVKNPDERITLRNPNVKPEDLVETKTIRKTTEDENKELVLQLLRTEFDKLILYDQITRRERIDSGLNGDIPRIFPNNHDVDLNYNIKANYVNYLQDKYLELYSVIKDKDQAKLMTERQQNLEMLKAMKSDFQFTKEKYDNVKRKYKKSKIYVSKYETLRETAKKMRKAIQGYREYGFIGDEIIDDLNIYTFDPELDENPFSNATNKGNKKQARMGGIEDDVTRMLGQRDRKIIELSNDIKKLQLRIRTMEANRLDVTKLSMDEVEKRLAILRNAYEQEISQLITINKEEITLYKKKIYTTETNQIRTFTKFNEQIKKLEKNKYETEIEMQSKINALNQALIENKVMKARVKKQDDNILKLESENRVLMSKLTMRGVNKLEVKQSEVLKKWREFVDTNRPELLSLQMPNSKFEKSSDFVNEITNQLKWGEDIAIKFNQLLEAKEEFYNKATTLSEEYREVSSRLQEFESKKEIIEAQMANVNEFEAKFKNRIDALEKQLNEANLRIVDLEETTIKQIEDLGMKDIRVTELTQSIKYNETIMKAQVEEIKQLESKILELLRDIEMGKMANEKQIEQLGVFNRDNDVDSVIEEAEESVIFTKDPQVLTEKLQVQMQTAKHMKKVLKSQDEKIQKLNALLQTAQEANDKAVKEMIEVSKELAELKDSIQKEKEAQKAKYHELQDKIADGEYVPVIVLNNIKANLSLHETKVHHLQKIVTEKTKQIEQKDGLLSTLQNKLTKYNDEYKELFEEIGQLRKFHETMTADASNKDIVDIKTDNFNLKQKIEEMKNQQSKMNFENQEIRDKLSQYLSQIETLENEKHNLNKTISEMNVKITQFNLTIKSLEQKIQNWENQRTEYRKRIEEKDKFISDQAEQISSLQSKVEDLDNSDPKAELRLRKLEREKEKAITINQQLNDEIKKLMEQIKLLKEELNSAEDLIRELKVTDTGELRERVIDQTQQILQMIRLSNERQTEIEKLENEVEDLKSEKRQLEFQLEARDRKIEIYRNSSKTIEDNRSLYLQRCRERYNVSDEIKNTFQELQTIYEKLTEFDDRLALMENADEKTLINNPLIKKMQETLHNNSLEISAKTEMISSLNQRLEKVTFELGRNEVLLRSYVDKIEEKHEEIVHLNLRIGELTFTSNQLHKNIEALRNYNREAEAKVREVHRELDDALADKEDFDLKINLFEMDGKLYKEKIQNLLDQIARKDKEIEECKAENYELQEGMIMNTEEFFEKINQLRSERDEADLKYQEASNESLHKNSMIEELKKKISFAELEKKKLEEHNKELNVKVDEIQKMSKLSPAFVQKIQAYKTDEAAIEALQTENANLAAKVILLENQLNAAFDADPQINKIFNENNFQTTFSGLEKSEVHKPANLYGTTLADRRITKSNFNNAYEDRLHVLRKKMDMLEIENQNLIKNLNNYIEKTKRESINNEPMRVKDFYTNNPQVMQNIKLELLNRSRKIESLHLTINRMAEDYRILKEEANALEDRVHEKENQLRVIDNERIAYMEKYLHLKQKEKLGEIFKDENLNEANKKVLDLIKEKDDQYHKMFGIYQARIEGMIKIIDKHEECQHIIKEHKQEIKQLNEKIESMTHKLQAAKSQVKDSSEVYESLQEVHSSTLKELHSLQDTHSNTAKEVSKYKDLNAEWSQKNIVLEGMIEKVKSDLKEKTDRVNELDHMVNYLEKLINTKKQGSELIENAAMIIDAKEEKIYRLQLQLKKHDSCKITENKLKQQILESQLAIKKLETKIIDLEQEIEKLIIVNKTSTQELDERTTDLVLAKESLQHTMAALKKHEQITDRVTKTNMELRLHIEQLMEHYTERESEHARVISEMQDDFKVCFDRLKILADV